MASRSTREKYQRKKDAVLFGIVLLMGAVGFGYLAAYENGHFDSSRPQLQSDDQRVGDESSTESSPGKVQGPENSSDADPPASQADPLYQPTLVPRNVWNENEYVSLTDSERESLQHIADAVDTTLKGKRYQGQLTADDLKVADRYSTLINQTRWREFWYRTAVRTAGFGKFQRLRDRGDKDDFRSAAIAWVRLDGFTRGVLLEALQAIDDDDEELLKAHRDTINDYPFILGIEIPGREEPNQPLRAPRS